MRYKKLEEGSPKPEVLKQLGKNQLRLLQLMAKDNLVIRVFKDESRLSEDINLEDEEGGNTYEKVLPTTLETLNLRNLFSVKTITLALYIQEITYRLKDEVKLEFL